MATFTMSLKRAIELTGGTVDMGGPITHVVGGNIGLDVYPIFDESHREILNGKIVDHFWNREIGRETVDDFRRAMRLKMNEIMPYYNKLYESERIKYDPLITMGIKNIGKTDTTQETTSHGENNTTSDSSSKSRSVSSETPQTMLGDDGQYATTAADSNGQVEATGTAEEDSTATMDANAVSESETTGFQGSLAELIMRQRETFINIDLMVISQLEPLFMLVWDNGDSYTQERYYL